MKKIQPAYERLIQDLIDEGCLKTPLVIEAFRSIDRADFVPDEFKAEAYLNHPLPTLFGQTISQPLTVAFMLELLKPRPGDHVLDIGAGSGWQAALLAYIVSKAQIANGPVNVNALAGKKAQIANHSDALPGKVVAIERVPVLKLMATTNVAKYGFIEKGVVEIVVGDGTKGYPEDAPFDKIIAAATTDKVPVAWKNELKIGGRIVAPLGDSICVFDKITASDFNFREYRGFSFVPLIADEGGDM